MTYIYSTDLAQFSDDFWPTVDPYRLPGTTVDVTSRADGSGQSYLSPNNWVGGYDPPHQRRRRNGPGGLEQHADGEEVVVHV
jgi:hypothetical protein